jgi:hypothetical protein
MSSIWVRIRPASRNSAALSRIFGAGRRNLSTEIVSICSVITQSLPIGGGRLIVVGAVDDSARRFYERFHFTPVGKRENRLVMKVSTAVAALREDQDA